VEEGAYLPLLLLLLPLPDAVPSHPGGVAQGGAPLFSALVLQQCMQLEPSSRGGK